jgi:choline monooxygenase
MVGIPLEQYFSHDHQKLEQENIFARSPIYLGHRAMVPELDNYAVIDQNHNSQILINRSGGLRIMSNVCRHRQALMLEGSGRATNIVCPLHRWTYDLDGKLIGCPHFQETPDRNLMHTEFDEWNGLLFKNGKQISQELATVPFFQYLDFSHYVFHSKQRHQCHYNWKTFIEVYMDDYHVEPFHPGLGSFVNCKDLEWHLGTHYNIQAVGLGDLGKPSTDIYDHWKSAVREEHADQLPAYGAIWMTIFPNIMVEWYPKTLVISTVIPESPQSTINHVEFYYHEDVAYFNPGYIQAQQAAYNETVKEDDEIALRMDRGRRSLLEQNQQDQGPFHQDLERGIPHFYGFLAGKSL